jgi:tetraacyldisaccharide 4'-kinase
MQEYLYSLATDRKKGFIAVLIKILLFALSLIYGLLLRVLIFIYSIRPHRLKCKVISVGNITLGGTGKTSLVEFIARYLKKEGHKLAILSRGYKRKITGCGLENNDYAAMGDEPQMLKNNLKGTPVLVDTNRIRAANLGIHDYGVDTVILDDGLQQWKIKKDLEIVAIDAGNPFGNRQLLPRGILRQPLSTLGKADIFILTKTDLSADTEGIKNYLKRINPLADIFESMHKPAGFYKLGKSEKLFDADALKGKNVTVFSGIADPFYFENTLKNLKIDIGLSFRFPDHHPYSQKDLTNIAQESRRKNIEAIVTTEKDAVRLDEQALSCSLAAIFVLRIELAITKDEERFYYRLRKLYSL